MLKYILLLTGFSSLAACSAYDVSPNYSTYDCNQLFQEKRILKEELQAATAEETKDQIYQLAIAAFAMSNGTNYTAKSDTKKSERLNVQLKEIDHESIRKQCSL